MLVPVDQLHLLECEVDGGIPEAAELQCRAAQVLKNTAPDALSFFLPISPENISGD